ncbi:Archaellum biogenesis protein FlaJ, TadC family [Halomicrobium zhouii]|uniref:Archaellum biogenesis protein FlaJ, TadC family n=1 Tax=Halomicrobium zhouii TaxID=767519 RepID=A0A1I6KID7_9EURY|nr:type II secretion system F family protein [Halomicrobium zhouii]SFR90987.1 Archaellum biogenesis protein FlaJ, TadC family [Halomicrobium zhouii]
MGTSKPPRQLNLIDRGLYALFAQHADGDQHDRDRERYRATDLDTGFDLYLARVYGLAWVSSFALGFVVFSTFTLLPDALLGGGVAFLQDGIPVINRITWPAVPQATLAFGSGVVVAVLTRWALIRAGGTYLGWAASARRADIEATLPGAVRYLRVLASGEHDQRAMLRRVADQDAYGETAVAFRRALNRAALTGSLDDGLERVASETPSRDLLAPFLLKFREHANQSSNALEGYLEMESRLLSHQQSRRQERATGYLELVAELFVVLLVLPALLVLIVTVMGVLSPGLSNPVVTPLGTTTVRGLLVLGSAVFVVSAGATASFVVTTLRPRNASPPSYERPDELLPLLESVPLNPASATVVMVPIGLCVAVGLWLLDYRLENVFLLSYAAFGLPIGVVSVRRARLDDDKDREIQDFVHAVSGHVSLGRPFSDAVERVAREVELGALQSDVDDLAFTLGLTSSPAGDSTDGRAAALDRFVEAVGTPMADQTIGLVVGALDAGSDAEDVFETLQTEIGTLYHERKALRSSLLVYVAVGWTTALLVIGIVVAVNTYVLDGFAQLSTVSGGQGLTIDPNAIDPARDRHRFYVVTQATMLACGWFAGTASRGFYEALLHSASLVTIAYVVFAGAGMI